jgi:hypothetical protein
MISRPADSRYDARAGWLTVACAADAQPRRRKTISGRS